jgi:hypothetical protein
MKTEVAERIRAIFNAPDAVEAKRLPDLFLNEYQDKAPKPAEMGGDCPA